MKRIPSAIWFTLAVVCFFTFVLLQENFIRANSLIALPENESRQEQMMALDKSLPEAAKDAGLEIADFEKKNLSSGKYYYEAVKKESEKIRLVCENVYDSDQKRISRITLYQIKEENQSPYAGKRIVLQQYSIRSFLENDEKNGQIKEGRYEP